ncbi:MAG: hypothetical protein P4L51_07570 [Puia sp.]|nr:hypothetical protein [Puia sp.]
MQRIKWILSIGIIKISHWEYWPTSLVFAPLGLYWVWMGLKARSFYFMSAANPGIHTGGFVMESKRDVYALLPGRLYPETLYIDKRNDDPGLVSLAGLSSAYRKNISFPCVAKPDIGMQGLGVKKIRNEEELQLYCQNMPFPFLIQSYIDYPNEAGIFYHRHPNEARGKISGIALKEFAFVTGNGRDTVETLVRQNKRYKLYWESIARELGDQVHIVLRDGETMKLLDYGNHARGSKFTDGTHLINAKLENLLNEICVRIPGFYIGRLDIKYNTWEELSEGRNFSIIELNGSGSNPTHIYDPGHSILFAWKEMARHWRLIYRIARYNHIHKDIAYLGFGEGVREVLAQGKIKKTLRKLL